MDTIRQYLLSVVISAIICGIVVNLIGKNSVYSTIVKLLTGLFLSITVVSPWTKLQFGDLSSYLGSLELDAATAVSDGESIAADSMTAIIKDRLEAYILDKASSMDVTLDVEVEITDAYPLKPCSVSISGDVSPYAKQRLKQIITDDLGIPKENQVWK